MRNETQTKMHRILTGAVAAASLLGAAWGQGPGSMPAKGDILRASGDLGLGLENRLQYTDKLMAWATPDSIRIALISWACPASICATCSLVRHQLPGIPLPGIHPAVPPVFAIARRVPYLSKNNAAEAAIVVAMPNGKLYRYLAAWPTEFSTAPPSLETDSIPMGLRAGQTLSLLALETNPWNTMDGVLFFGGPNGLFLSSGLPQGQGMGVPVRPGLLPPSPEGFSAYGEGTFGGTAGSVMEWQYDVPPRITATGIPTAIRKVDRSGAMADMGWVAVREGNAWSAFKLPPGEFRDFEIVRDGRGLGILRYPKNGEPVYALLRETPSYLNGITLNGVHSALVPALIRAGRNEEGLLLDIALADSEGDFSAPRIDWIHGKADTAHLIAGFTGTSPQGVCQTPGLCVQAGLEKASLYFGDDSVFLTMAVQSNLPVGFPVCGPFGPRRDSLYKAAHAWRSGDTLEIREGAGRLLIVNEDHAALRLPRAGAGSRGNAEGSPLRDAAGRSISADGSGGKEKLRMRTYRLR